MIKIKKSILNIKINSLDLKVENGPIQRAYNQLLEELAAKQIEFKPNIWISDDWYVPGSSTGFAIPFYLLSKELIEVQEYFLGRCEGKTHNQLMKLMRHECAHAIDNAFKLKNNKDRIKIFGNSLAPYPSSYQLKNTRNKFVHHLGENYASAHPEEDWAETFAIWLDPQSKWQKKYKAEALAKLNCVERIFTGLRNQPQKHINNRRLGLYSRDHRTLREYIREKRNEIKPPYEMIYKKLKSYRVQSNAKAIKKISIQSPSLNSLEKRKLIKEINFTCKKYNLQLDFNNRITQQALNDLCEIYKKKELNRVYL